MSVADKVELIATRIYGAKRVEFLPKAKQHLGKIDRLNLSQAPICMAKTQYSFSDDARKIGRPRDFTITVREIEVAAGAGFVIPITGEMLRMPALPPVPAALGMNISPESVITGLS